MFLTTAYYNEHDPYAAEWLRNLIKAGHIAQGVVDERSIEDVTPADLKGFNQCHFFAGIGVWSHALRRAGWPDDRQVWTGSCPCQPFSAAGKAGGFDDERHLWPAFHHLIQQCSPDVVFGEQVASKDGLNWFDLVQADMEGAGYSCGAVDLCAAGIGAPHIRQRLWFVAERMGYSFDKRLEGFTGDDDSTPGWAEQTGPVTETSCVNGMADSELPGPTRQSTFSGKTQGTTEGIRNGDEGHSGVSNSPPTNGFWRDADWLFCRDGKWRPVEPGTFPLAHGSTSRVGRLRAYGNAINAEAAEAFIKSYMEV